MNMWSYQMYFSGGQEHFEYDPWGGRGSAATQRSFPYLESLLCFLELDCAQVEELLRREPRPAPWLAVDPAVTDFYAFTADSFRLEGYEPWSFAEKIEVAL